MAFGFLEQSDTLRPGFPGFQFLGFSGFLVVWFSGFAVFWLSGFGNLKLQARALRAPGNLKSQAQGASRAPGNLKSQARASYFYIFLGFIKGASSGETSYCTSSNFESLKV
jgi:hypothetical protein